MPADPPPPPLPPPLRACARPAPAFTPALAPAPAPAPAPALAPASVRPRAPEPPAADLCACTVLAGEIAVAVTAHVAGAGRWCQGGVAAVVDAIVVHAVAAPAVGTSLVADASAALVAAMAAIVTRVGVRLGVG